MDEILPPKKLWNVDSPVDTNDSGVNHGCLGGAKWISSISIFREPKQGAAGPWPSLAPGPEKWADDLMASAVNLQHCQESRRSPEPPAGSPICMLIDQMAVVKTNERGTPFIMYAQWGGGGNVCNTFSTFASARFSKAENLRKRYTVTASWKAGTIVGRQKQMAANGPGKVREFAAQCWNAFKLL